MDKGQGLGIGETLIFSEKTLIFIRVSMQEAMIIMYP